MDVMMKMTTEDVRRLRARFASSLSLGQFVPLMKSALHDRIANELDFVIGAVELFHTIDVNGDRKLEWDEFAGYMLDAGQARAEAMGDEDAKLYRAWPLAFRDPKTPMGHIKGRVRQLVHLPDLAAVAFFECGADVVYTYALRFDQNDAPRHLSTMRLHTAFQEHEVLGMAYVPLKRWLVISSMRRPMAYLSVWQLPELGAHSHSPMMLRRIELASPQEQLTWLPTLQVLASASAVFPSISSPPTSSKQTKVHQLLLWDLSTLATLRGFDHAERIKGVTALIGFTTPSNRVFLVAGREDGQLTVVETGSGRDVQTLDAHGHGVRVLALSSEYEVLASAGAHAYASDESSHHILIWRIASNGHLSVDTTLRDHDAPLQLLQFVDSKQQLLSADVRGVFRVYSSAMRASSLEKWQCLQVFDACYRVYECLVVPETAESDAVLMTAGSRVVFFDLCVSRDREEVLFAYYCNSLNVVLVATATTLLLWDADTGRLKKTFPYASVLRSTPPSGYNDDDSAASRVITAVCVDDRERKVLLGDDRGSIRVVNIVNGNVMKALDPHNAAVLWLSYVLHSKRVLSVSLDAVLHVYDENNPVGFYVTVGVGGTGKPQSVLLQALRILPDATPPLLPDTDSAPPPRAKFEVVRAVGNQELDLLAVLIHGSKHSESFIQVWNFDLSHAQGTCVAPDEQEITCLSFVGSSSDLVAGTTYGGVYMWSTQRVEFGAYQCCVEFITRVEDREVTAGGELNEEAAPSLREPEGCCQILHILTMVATEARSTTEQTPRTSTFLTADGAPTSTLSSDDFMGLGPKNHDIDERMASEAANGLYVVASDESGFVTTWLYSNCASRPTTQQEREHQQRKIQKNAVLFPHDEMAMGYEAVAALHTNALEGTRVRPAQRCCAIARWQAHASAVTSLRQSTSDPQVLLTSSASGKVKVWSVTGELFGVLDHYATRRAPERLPWRFPVDMKERQRRKEVYAQRFLDDHRSALSKHKNTTRLSVLQERLSLTPQEMANERASLSTPKTTRRRITKTVQSCDVNKAIRQLILSQAVPVPNMGSKHGAGTNGPLVSVAALCNPREPSLHAILTELDGMQPPASAPTGEFIPIDSNERLGGGRRRYSMVTVEGLKHALKPRSRRRESDSKGKSSAAVHCKLPPLTTDPGTRSRQRELCVTSEGCEGIASRDLLDIRNEMSMLESSNQDADAQRQRGFARKKKDRVLGYHVKLAHSWMKYSAG